MKNSFARRPGFAAMLLAAAVAWPGLASAETLAGEFMTLGAGARSLGMGGAFCAVANDASSIYWNPAGMSGTDKRQALFMHAEQFGDLINYNFASFTMPTTTFVSSEREAAWGLALIHLGVSDIPITNHLQMSVDVDGDGVFEPEEGDRLAYDPALIPYESNNDFALFGGFAMNTTLGRVGGALKLIYTNTVAGFSSTGIGLDLGYVRQNLLLPRLDIGVKLQDITGTYISWSSGTNEFITPSVRLGGAYRVASSTLNGSFLITGDMAVFFDDRRQASQVWVEGASADFFLGGELRFQEKVMVRGGVDAGNPTAGAGFRIGWLGLDYAYLHHDDFEATHRVSAQAEF